MRAATAHDPRAVSFDISDAETGRRKAFLESGAEHARTVAELRQLAREYADPVIDEVTRRSWGRPSGRPCTNVPERRPLHVRPVR